MADGTLKSAYRPAMGCRGCVCEDCLHHKNNAGDCAYGDCFDDWRARHDPFPYGHRTGWSDCERPMEQEHWCRGGSCYACAACERFEPYDGSKTRVERCVGQNVLVYQNGHVRCGLVDCMGCETCIETYLRED